MASKPVLMTAFYEQLTSLVKQMSEMYPDDSDFPLFLTTISLMKNANPSMMIKYVNDNVGKFEDKIMAKDDSFFLDYSFDEYAGYVDTNIFSKLKQYKNRGLVGPKNPVNFALRVGGTQVIENAFVHRSHYTLFETFFHPSIRNWHCDEWLTQIYQGFCSYTDEEVLVDNGCIDKRYQIESVTISEQIREGREKIRKDLHGCFSFCLYGSYTEKYYQGLVENIRLIQEHYPKCDIKVYASPEASVFVHELNVTLHTTSEDGSRNMSYRFLPAFTDNYEFVCVRDTDSRIHARDRWCIDTFLDSPFTAYTIRDHSYHTYLIMGGLWGCKGKIDLSPDLLVRFVSANPNRYTLDTDFLNTYVHPLIRSSFLVFSFKSDAILGDSTETIKIIDYPLVNQEFCGNVVLYSNRVPYHEFVQV
jgi:hypothetical protein